MTRHFEDTYQLISLLILNLLVLLVLCYLLLGLGLGLEVLRLLLQWLMLRGERL